MLYNRKKYRLNYKNKYPWMKSYFNARERCNNKTNNRYSFYGKKGIKFLLTKEEIKEIWVRDSAHLMKRPSIDRIDNNGDYTLENCQFIELSENSRKNKYKSILQYDLEGNLIKEFSSTIEASRHLHILRTAITNCLNKLTKTAGSYFWRFKNEL